MLRSHDTTAKFSVAQRVAQLRESHARFRRLLGEQLPEAKTTILIMLSSAHHSSTQLSYVATRNRKGLWTVNRVGRTTSELPDTPLEDEPATRTALSEETGRRLDVLINDPCLYAQPFMTSDDKLPPVGEWETSIAVIVSEKMYAGYAFGPIPSVGGEIVTAITQW